MPMMKETMLKRLLLPIAAAGGGGSAPVQDTATGNPLVFFTDLARPLKSLLVPFTPIQEGSGDPSPSNIRSILPWNGLTVNSAGKNWFDENVNQSFTQYKRIDLANPLTAGTYVFTATVEGTTESSYVSIAFAKEHNVLLAKEKLNNHERGSVAFTVADEVNIIYLYADVGYSEGAGKDVIYSGIMITDQTPSVYPVSFPAMGKNLLNPEKYIFNTNTSRGLTFEVQPDGSVKVTGTTESSDFGPTLSVRFQLPAGTYYGYRDDGDVYVTYRKSTAEIGGETSGLISPFTLDGSEWVYCNIYVRNPGTFDTIIHPQIARENTQTAYEPYTNAVYGGTPDIISGRMLVEWALVDASDLTWVNTNQSEIGVFRANLPTARNLDDMFNVYSDKYKNGDASKSIAYMDDNTIKGYNGEQYQDYVYIRDGRYTDVADFTQELDCKICYQLATPQEIQLTPTQLTALLGQNTIWSDADGSMTAVYLKKG